ncbi:putative ferredoxin-like protein YdhY [Thermotalea metallivorans]|uniref:Putative ferredoxin-like protein YdhY n=2 Tax=Thermotalea metallivorans TaxID=520762 RepID=A0A140L9G7_9FIRM|nr:putative ferredoxin-like protein YdhY [Thermotalea metallivorans]
MLACARTVHGDYSPVKSAIQIRSSGGLQGKFVADICRGCIHPPCAQACATGALTARKGGGVGLHREKCIGCKKCIDACLVGAIRFDQREGIPIICIQCGACTKNCPHGVLRMEVSSYAE